MNITRKQFTTIAMGALATALCTGAWAQGTYPTKNVTMVVPTAAGGTTDLSARMLAQALAPVLGQSVIVDNKGGGNGNIAASIVKRAEPDGYTVFMQYSGYHVGNGSLQHVTGAMLEQQGAIKMVHVPYKGTGPALQDLLGGQVDLTFGTAPPFMPHIASGKLRVLAVTGKERLPSLPDVPTTAEAGYSKVDATSWFAVFVPAAVPKPVVDKLTADIRTVVQSAAFKQKALEQGATADYQTPAQLGDKVKTDLANWAQVVKTSRIEAE